MTIKKISISFGTFFLFAAVFGYVIRAENANVSVPPSQDSGAAAKSTGDAAINEIGDSNSAMEEMPGTEPLRSACDRAQISKVNPSFSLEMAIPKLETTVSKDGSSNDEKADDSKTIPSVPDAGSETAKNENRPLTSVLPLPELHFTLEEKLAGPVPGFQDSQTDSAKPQSLPELSGDFQKDSLLLSEAWSSAAYQAPTEDALSKAYEEVRSAGLVVDRLFAKTEPAKREAWVQFLHWNVLNLNGPADSAALQEVHHQLTKGTYGLELEFFVRLRTAMERFLAIDAQIRDQETSQTLFKAASIRAAKLLALAQKEPSSQIHCAIKDLMNWMSTMNQAQELQLATVSLWSKPNLRIHVNQSVFARLGNQKIEQEEDVRDQVERATVRGKTLFSGDLSIATLPNEKRAEFGIVLAGSSTSKTHSYAGPAIVSSNAKSKVSVTKSIFFDPAGFTSSTAKVKINTNSQIENVQDFRNRPLIESIATRRAFAKKDEMEMISVAQNSARLRQRFDRTVSKNLEDWNSQLANFVNQQLKPRGLASDESRTCSSETGADFLANLACRTGFCSSVLPPEPNTESDMQFMLHESAIEEFFVGYLGGMSLTPFARAEFLKTLPEEMQKSLTSSEDSDVPSDWTMNFLESWPIQVAFKDGKIQICIHCTKMIYDEKSYPAVNVSALYGIEMKDGQPILVRQGDVEVLPPDFNPAQKKRLPSSMVSLRRVLGKRLEKAFSEEIVLKEFKVVRDEKNPNPRFANLYAKPVFMQAENGWLQVGMNFYEKTPETTAATPEPQVTQLP